MVFKSTGPENGALQLNQADRPPVPAWKGSPVSLVAPVVSPVLVMEVPEISKLELKKSFTGCAAALSGNRAMT